MSDFLHMGGFGSYIWSAIGIAALLMFIEPLTLVLRKKSVIRTIQRSNRQGQRCNLESSNIEANKSKKTEMNK